MCERKRRFLARDERHVKAGFHSYQRFMELTLHRGNKKTFNDFIESPYYTVFVKFGSFIINSKPLYPLQYVEHVIRSGTKIEKWYTDEIYDQYLVELLKTEPVDNAISRSIQTMIDWGEKNSKEWTDYFVEATSARLINDIRYGKVSPWLVLNSTSSREKLKTFNDEQLAIISVVLDFQAWKKLFKSKPDDVALCKEVIKEANLK